MDTSHTTTTQEPIVTLSEAALKEVKRLINVHLPLRNHRLWEAMEVPVQTNQAMRLIRVLNT